MQTVTVSTVCLDGCGANGYNNSRYFILKMDRKTVFCSKNGAFSYESGESCFDNSSALSEKWLTEGPNSPLSIICVGVKVTDSIEQSTYH